MIKYEPSKLLKKIVPVKRIKKLLRKDLEVKRTALNYIDQLSGLEVLDKEAILDTALKVSASYQKRVNAETDKATDLKDDPKLLVQRVENEVVLQITEGIKDKYAGESYIWLPSDAEEPDPEHQLNYGKEFKVGDGEMPGERWGCRCGMQILVNQTKLNL